MKSSKHRIMAIVPYSKSNHILQYNFNNSKTVLAVVYRSDPNKAYLFDLDKQKFKNFNKVAGKVLGDKQYSNPDNRKDENTSIGKHLDVYFEYNYIQHLKEYETIPHPKSMILVAKDDADKRKKWSKYRLNPHI